MNFFDAAKGSLCGDLIAAQKSRTLGSAISFDNLDEVTKCLSNDQTIIKDYDAKVNYQLNRANRFGYLFVSDDKVRNHRGASSTTQPEATTRQFSPEPPGISRTRRIRSRTRSSRPTSWYSTTR